MSVILVIFCMRSLILYGSEAPLFYAKEMFILEQSYMQKKKEDNFPFI